MPRWFGGGCLGWMVAIVFWTVAGFGLLVVAPVVVIGWFIIIFAVAAAIGGGGA